MKKRVICLAFFAVTLASAKRVKKSITQKPQTHTLTENYKWGRPFDFFYSKRVRHYLQDTLCDSCNILHNFLSLSSLKVATGMTPLYLIGKRADKAIHRQFYDAATHTNKHQPPKFFKHIALDDRYIGIPFGVLGFISLVHHDPFKRRRAQVFATGLTWAYILKKTVKLFKTDSNLRPFNGEFPQEPCYNGNPSGHMTITTYLATFWGCQEGVRFGLPLGLFSAFAFTMNVVSNHHYFSQAVAGTGVGLALGIATSKTFDALIEPINDKISFGMDLAPHGGWRLKLAYDF